MQQDSDFQDEFHIFTPVEPLSGIGSFRLDLLELRFPVTQDMGSYLREFADFTNFKVKLVWNVELHVTSLPLSLMTSWLVKR